MSLSREELLNWAENRVVFGEGIDILENDCEIIAFMLDNCEIEIPERNRIFVKVNCAGISNLVIKKRKRILSGLLEKSGLGEGVKALAYTGDCDYSHTTAEWDSVINLGIYGLRNRIEEYARVHIENEKAKGFYEQILSVYDAALRFMKRAADQAALSGRAEMANALLNLIEGGPSNLFEALQTSIIYYYLQHFFDGILHF